MHIWSGQRLLVVGIALLGLHLSSCMIVEHNHSDQRMPSGYDYIKNIKAAIEFDLRDKRVVKCYQCVYSPPRLERKLVSRRMEDGHRELVNVTKEIQGGWAPCKGPFTKTKARQDGIDAGHCLSNCYTRLDHLGNMLRGCYRGEYGVNPNRTGCHQQAGYIYCFCEGDRCNNHLPSSLPETTQAPDPPEVRRVHAGYREPFERGRSYQRSQYSQPDRQNNIYNLRYRDRDTSRAQRNSDRESDRTDRETDRTDRETDRVTDRETGRDTHRETDRDAVRDDRYIKHRFHPTTKPKTREYHDKNPYTLINSEYEKEVKEDQLPATRYRSVAEFGREAPSSVNKNKYSSYKDDQTEPYRLKLSPYNKGTYAKDIYDKKSIADRNSIGKLYETSTQKTYNKSPLKSEDLDRSRYRPVYQSYKSGLADEYRRAEENKREEGIDHSHYSKPDGGSSHKMIESVVASGTASASFRDGNLELKVQSTTQQPRTPRTLSSTNDIGTWNFADEFMTEPVENDDRKSNSRWPTYKSTADDNNDKKSINQKTENSQSWYLKEPENPNREIVSNSQTEKRREKQGLYDHRWYF